MAPRAAVVAALACLVVGLAGCTSAPLLTTVTHPIPPPTPSQLTGTPRPTPSQLTGTQLQAALLPLSDFPHGYAIDSQDSSNSGSSLLSGTASPTASPPTASPQDCLQLYNATIEPSTGFTAGASQLLYDTTIYHPNSYPQRLYGQAIFQFATPSGAGAHVNSDLSVVSRCPTATTTESGNLAAVKLTASPAPQVAGHKAFLFRETGTVDRVSDSEAYVVTMDGTDVYVVWAAAYEVPLTARPSAFAALAAKLIARVDAMG